MGDVMSLRMTLTSDLGAKTTSNSMLVETRFPTLLRARLPCCKIEKTTFYILRIILSIRLEELMLRNLIMFLIVLIFKNEVSSSRHTTYVKMLKKIVDASDEPSK
jgi:hypothetical protein